MDKISAFNERVASLGLNKVATLFAGAPLLTESAENSFKFTHKSPAALKKIADKIGLTEGFKIEGCDLIYDFSEAPINEASGDQGELTAATVTLLNKAFYDAGWGRTRTLGPVVSYNVPGEEEDVDIVTVDASDLYTIKVTYKDQTKSFNGVNPEEIFDWVNEQVGEYYSISLNESTYKRHQLPQLELDAFIADLKKYGIDCDEVEFDAVELSPSQSEFNDEKVQRIIEDKSWGKKPIITSNDKVIVDGHHRWKAAFETGNKVKAISVGKSFDEIIAFVKDKEYAAYKKLHESKFTLNEAHEAGEYISADYQGDGEARIYACHDVEGKCIYNLQIVTRWGELVDNDDFDLLDHAVTHAREYGIRFKPEDVGSLRK